MTSHNYASIPTKGLGQLKWIFKPLPKGSRSVRERIRIAVATRFPSLFKKNKVKKIDGDMLKIDTSPYISANFFRWRSQVTIDKSTDLTKIMDLLKSHSNLKINIFCHSDRFSHLVTMLVGLGVDTSSWILFVGRGNGYFIPNEIYELASKFKYVYVQHLLGQIDYSWNLRPLPTGIATQYVSPGVINLMKKVSIMNNTDAKLRKTRILVNFDCSNNIQERLICYKVLQNHPSSYIIGKESFNFVFRKMTEIMFVASPPGAGPDCYRTWEAIYAGAVPIVLEHAFPNYRKNYPVWVIHDWSELLNYDGEKLKEKYFEILNVKTDVPCVNDFKFY